MMRELLLAVDGGGTHTQALVADVEGNVLARGLGPASNLHNMSFAESCRAVGEAIERALVAVLGPGPSPRWRDAPLAAACLGLSGVDAPEDEAEVTRWVADQGIARSFRVVNDSELVLAAGTPDGWGVALVSGTGSVCLARAPGGESVRVGGWGPLLGDEGSAYDVGLRALRLAAQAADGRSTATALLSAVLRHLHLDVPSALIRYVHAPRVSPADIAALAPVVAELAEHGEPAAAGVIAGAARELARHVDTAVERLRLSHPPLALGGGALRGALRAALLASIRSGLGPVQDVADPPLGAVVLARRLLTAPVRG
jgi:N-acetylglucosamine kinase-like BadF-type ATPase